MKIGTKYSLHKLNNLGIALQSICWQTPCSPRHFVRVCYTLLRFLAGGGVSGAWGLIYWSWWSGKWWVLIWLQI